MEINVGKAIGLFFPNPSLEYVYYEAIANSIDAGASHIEVSVDIDSFTDSDSLTLRIKDDGNGFDEKSYARFCTLLEIEEQSHKGIGRLVFLHYFSFS